ncbi:recombinase family protein [Streptomyces odonnellii]|uniref:recombinase family protein n=1 Tax=Streptomyces odonnellii TaxID=1417980 RepID=UPI000AC4DB36|nr:recombinase family protein [Streptomyces odonnellii]
MANLVYKRVSTDQQSTARQDLVLDEAGIKDPVVFEEAPGTSSRLHPLQRSKFRELLTYTRPGDTVHISERFRLVRGTGHIRQCLGHLRVQMGDVVGRRSGQLREPVVPGGRLERRQGLLVARPFDGQRGTHGQADVPGDPQGSPGSVDLPDERRRP